MARVSILAALTFAGLGLAGCGNTGGFSAEASPNASVGAVELDAAAKKAAKDAEYRALEFGRVGTPVTWQAGKSHGEIVPGPLYHVNSNDCRDFTHTVYLGGASHATRATACRRADGTWQPIS
jgi:surface antigen